MMYGIGRRLLSDPYPPRKLHSDYPLIVGDHPSEALSDRGPIGIHFTHPTEVKLTTC